MENELVLIQHSAILSKQFCAFKDAPHMKSGVVNFQFSDNKEECLSEDSKNVQWKAKLRLSAYDSPEVPNEEEKDNHLIMESSIEIRIAGKILRPDLVGKYIDLICQMFQTIANQQLTTAMQTLLTGTSYSQMPVPVGSSVIKMPDAM